MEGNLADKHDSGSPWAVAYQLMLAIAREEGLHGTPAERASNPRAYFLKLYAESLEAIASRGLPTG